MTSFDVCLVYRVAESQTLVALDSLELNSMILLHFVAHGSRLVI